MRTKMPKTMPATKLEKIEFYREAVTTARFQRGTYSIENALPYAAAQAFYRKQDDAYFGR